MSGYFQRLVDSAAGRASAVHPRTGSIFSPRAEERQAPLHGWEETEQGTPPQPPSHPHAAPAELSSPEAPRGIAARSAAPGSEHTPLLPEPGSPERRAAAQAPPLLPPAPGSITRSDDPLDNRRPETLAEPARHPFAADTDAHVGVTSPAALRAADAFRPVMPPARASEAVVSAAEPRERPRRRHATHAAPPQDDIQIHIGRIEVVAVPPPAQAPRAPKAADAGLSLDAYLNRRHERAR
jgi:hypothetical protein